MRRQKTIYIEEDIISDVNDIMIIDRRKSFSEMVEILLDQVINERKKAIDKEYNK
jgi:hypothetical protein